MRAIIHTTSGDIAIQLFPEAAPKTVANFVELAKGERPFKDPKSGEMITKPFYDGVIFHRVIDGFMIQGGCPLGTGTGGPGYSFDDEIDPNLTFEQPYMLAMANAGLRHGPDGKPHGTNGSQFFITLAPTTWLQGKHTIFGQVEPECESVVDTIGAVRTGAADRPMEDVVITSVEIED